MRNRALLCGSGLLAGWAMYMPVAAHPWYEYPTLWVAVGVIIGGLLNHPTRQRNVR